MVQRKLLFLSPCSGWLNYFQTWLLKLTRVYIRLEKTKRCVWVFFVWELRGEGISELVTTGCVPFQLSLCSVPFLFFPIPDCRLVKFSVVTRWLWNLCGASASSDCFSVVDVFWVFPPLSFWRFISFLNLLLRVVFFLFCSALWYKFSKTLRWFGLLY